METATPAPPTAPDEERLAQARRRVEALKAFYTHLIVFALVLAGLTIINVVTGGPWWVQWVLLGWGVGIIAHALTVFGQTSRAVAEWEQRKLREFMSDGKS